jgi:phenylalanyl-tRNA synthetase alpha chain
MKEQKGHLHPITLVINDIVRIFSEMGFTLADGPEIETEHYNFDALNVPKDHPSRDMQDTFWLKPSKDVSGVENRLLRTQTSAVQARYMEKNKPPLRIICPGKTYRKEATDATHEMQFQQFEGLLVEKEASLATLKSVLNTFYDKFFGKDVNVRFRPSYFPFVEPGAEIDISCFKCKGGEVGCPVCKGTGWVEVAGAGVVHPKVLNDVGVNPNEWKGIAFGGSIERLAMIKYGVDDIRLFYSGDLRLVNQF